MKGIPKPRLAPRLQRLGRLTLIALVALAMLASALPQPVQAAVEAQAPCTSNYIVLKGDTTTSIARKFNLGWWEIAKANNMPKSTKPKVGQALCIPPKGWASQTVAGTMTAYAVGAKLTVTVSNFDARYLWTVKVKDTTGKNTTDYKVGRMIIPKNTKVTQAFLLPSELRNTPYLTVCLKNLTTNDKICRYIIHYP
jgi:LysM repeat protein